MSEQSSCISLASIVGQWRLISIDLEVKDVPGLRPALGRNPTGRLIILPTSVMMAVITPSSLHTPETHDKLEIAFQSMIAYSGPFRLEGDQLLTSVDVSWNKGWANTVQARTVSLHEPNLTLVSAWAQHPVNSSQTFRGIVYWVREA